jgi:hypothetical protein
MAERGLQVGHSTIGRWALRYALSFTNEFVETLAVPTVPLGSTKRTSALLDTGAII